MTADELEEAINSASSGWPIRKRYSTVGMTLQERRAIQKAYDRAENVPRSGEFEN